MRRLWMLSLVVGSLVVLGSSAVSAQDATPAAASDRSTFVVPPAQCVISTLLPGVLNSLATPAEAADETPAAMASDVPFAVPAGTPADAEIAAAVTAIFRQSFACENSGNLSRYFSLLTESEIRESFTADVIAGVVAIPPVPVPAEEQTALFAILEVSIHGDGSAGAYVIVDTVANPDPVEVLYMIAAETAPAGASTTSSPSRRTAPQPRRRPVRQVGHFQKQRCRAGDRTPARPVLSPGGTS